MAAKIPATVVTGFLGAGKTTLIRHLLNDAGGQRLGLIVNEFGDLGVDGEILKGCGLSSCRDEDIIELSNGCICCTVAEEFAPAMMSLVNSANPPDHIVIETSGLALPQPLVRAFSWPELRTRVSVDGVIAIVDGPAFEDGRFAHDIDAIDRQRKQDDNLDHETPLSELFEDQLACADLVIVSKADILGPDTAARVRRKLEADVRPGVQVITASGTVRPEILLGIAAAAENDLLPRSEIHHVHGDGDADEHGHDEFETMILEMAECRDAARLVAGIGTASARFGLLRVKGFAAIAGKPMRLVIQSVGPRTDSYFDVPFSDIAERRTRLVIIAEAGFDRRSVERVIRAAA